MLGHPVHETWSQPETGGIVFANFAGLEVRPGSAGLPMPGVRAAVVAQDRGGTGAAVPPRAVDLLDKPNEIGEVAIRAEWPSLCGGKQRDASALRVVDGWYLTGERAARDADGYFWFTGEG